eukprot:scaffold100220_cov24-Tisochrysis_lutea.AAC.1
MLEERKTAKQKRKGYGVGEMQEDWGEGEERNCEGRKDTEEMLDVWRQEETNKNREEEGGGCGGAAQMSIMNKTDARCLLGV